MAGPYFEEFEPGREFTHELSRRATEHDNIFFSLMTMNPQPIHIDRHFAAGTERGAGPHRRSGRTLRSLWHDSESGCLT